MTDPKKNILRAPDPELEKKRQRGLQVMRELPLLDAVEIAAGTRPNPSPQAVVAVSDGDAGLTGADILAALPFGDDIERHEIKIPPLPNPGLPTFLCSALTSNDEGSTLDDDR